jgi:hypothetical protein
VKRYSVRLSGQQKGQLHELLQKIRTTVEAADIPLPKREAIYRKINELGAEINRDRTRMGAFADFAGGLAVISAEAAKAVEPWWKWMKPIFEVLGSASEAEPEQPRIPPPPETKRLEPPKKKNPSFDSDLDDDVPF